MTKQGTRSQVNNFLIRQSEIESADRQSDECLYNNLGSDSIDAVGLIARLKELAGLRTPPEGFKGVHFMGDVVQAVSLLAANT